MRYNPLAYIHSEKDILKLVNCLMTNTKVKVRAATHSGTKRNGFCSFSLIAYLPHEARWRSKTSQH